MAFALMLGQVGFTRRPIHTMARAHIERAGEVFKITHIDLETEDDIPGIDYKRFQQQAAGCEASGFPRAESPIRPASQR